MRHFAESEDDSSLLTPSESREASMSVSKPPSRLVVTSLAALVMTASILLFSKANEMPISALAASPREVVWKGVDPDKVMGARSCSQCHRSETLAWKKMAHHDSHLHLLSESAREYAQAVGIDPATVRQADACVRCHATAQASQPDGIVRAVTGVSCESCHGEAGGEAAASTGSSSCDLRGASPCLRR